MAIIAHWVMKKPAVIGVVSVVVVLVDPLQALVSWVLYGALLALSIVLILYDTIQMTCDLNDTI